MVSQSEVENRILYYNVEVYWVVKEVKEEEEVLKYNLLFSASSGHLRATATIPLYSYDSLSYLLFHHVRRFVICSMDGTAFLSNQSHACTVYKGWY